MPGHPSFRTHAAARRASVDHTAAISAVRRASVDHTAGIIKPCDSTHAGHSPNITQCRPHAALHHECARMVVLANTANDVPALPQPLSGRQSPSVPKQEQASGTGRRGSETKVRSPTYPRGAGGAAALRSGRRASIDNTLLCAGAVRAALESADLRADAKRSPPVRAPRGAAGAAAMHAGRRKSVDGRASLNSTHDTAGGVPWPGGPAAEDVETCRVAAELSQSVEADSPKMEKRRGSFSSIFGRAPMFPLKKTTPAQRRASIEASGAASAAKKAAKLAKRRGSVAEVGARPSHNLGRRGSVGAVMMGVNHPGIRLAPRAARQAQKGDAQSVLMQLAASEAREEKLAEELSNARQLLRMATARVIELEKKFEVAKGTIAKLSSTGKAEASSAADGSGGMSPPRLTKLALDEEGQHEGASSVSSLLSPVAESPARCPTRAPSHFSSARGVKVTLSDGSGFTVPAVAE